MAKRKQDAAATPTILKFFRLSSPNPDASSSSDSERPSEQPSASGAAASSDDQSSTSGIMADHCADIGSVIKPGMTADGVTAAVNALSSGEKYKLLTNHFQPSYNFAFPNVFTNGCNRQFQYRWLGKYPWLAYSKIVNGGFCKFCCLFATNRAQLGALVNKPFTAWIKVQKIVDGHASNRYHVNATQAALDFQRSIETPQVNIDVRMNARLLENIHENRHIIKCCAEAILYCGRQCIALRGDVEKLSATGNPGNFLAMLKIIANHDVVLKTHLEKPRQLNATYLSPHTQNQIVDIIGKMIIQKKIVDEVKQAKFFTVLVDEVTSFNSEFMPLCVRFVDANHDIREELLQFSCLTRVTGEAIAAQICQDLEALGLQLSNIRGQGYDGASNMSSERVGVQARIREKSPLASYTHCSGHCLNLVISHSCALSVVRNVLDRVKATCLFFLKSPKRNGVLVEVVTKNVIEMGRRKPLIDICQTRWAERHSAFQHFYQCYTFIVIALEAIGLGLHRSDLSDNFKDATWDIESKSRANSLLHALTDFEFIVVFLVAYQFLSHLAGITVKLQSRTLDIVEAYRQIDEVKLFYKEIRRNVDVEFHKVYAQSERMGAAVNVEPCKPRSCARQRHRPNAEAESIEEWFRTNAAIPFLDHIITELDARFSVLAQTSSQLLELVPSVLCSRENFDLSGAEQLYVQDLPAPELLQQELTRWKYMHTIKAANVRATTCAKALKQCDKLLFPNLYVLLQIACTLPVTSCECERSASTLRRLRNFMRASMTDNRLSSLALMHIHYQQAVDLDAVVTLFAELHPRRLQLSSVLFETRSD